MSIHHRRVRLAAMAVAGITVVALLSACGSQARASFDGPSAEAVAAELSGKAPSGSAAGEGRLTQRNSGGSVTLDVTWRNPKAGGPLVFSVTMDTHSVNLDGYDLGKLTVLRNDQGQEVMPQTWDGPPGGHHRSGNLTFPTTDGSGRPIVGPGTKRLELVIRDVSGVKERVLTWELPL